MTAASDPGAEERAAIVAWLRDIADGGHSDVLLGFRLAANAIERLDHHKPADKGDGK